MNNTSVPSPEIHERKQVLSVLVAELDQLSPQVRKAASHVLENPNDVGISSIRELAQAADVNPNTLVRLARSFGFDGYEDFRELFREEIRRGPVNFPDRTRWLQSLGQNGKLGGLYRDMVSAAISNIEDTFSGIDDRQLQTAARTILKSKHVYTLGVGVNHSNAHNFTYLASTGMVQFQAIPKTGSNPIDDLAWAGKQDVLIALTCKPYRSEVVAAVKLAREQGVKVIGISDSAASPIVVGSDHGFVVAADTPQFFPTSITTIALLETLLSFVIALAPAKVVTRVQKFHDRRHQLGLYEEDV
ncbi:MAG: MurR/RpiR family transcriptional regulator [Granulosicoccus sp.]|nr:MurR/RpiR family transcriptional regulator [Granulosicoccus sp.]